MTTVDRRLAAAFQDRYRLEREIGSGELKRRRVFRLALPSSRKVAAIMVTLVLLIEGCARSEQPPAAEQAADSAPSAVPSNPDSSLPAPVSGLSSDLTAALESLLKGSSVDPGLWFSARTAHALRSATVELEQLNSTVFRLPAIQSVEYQLNGSCHRFWTWLQYSCHTIMRGSIVTPAVAAPLTVTPAIPAPRTVTPQKPASPSALSPAAGSVATPVELAELSAALDLPVQGVTRAQLRDTYNEQRAGHIHEALDIRAPRGTPVLSSAKGRLLKLFNSKPGGLMVYATDASERFILLYGHLDRYADGLSEGMPLERGQVIGFVGTTGNAPPDTPHLHFGILRGQPKVSWSKGTAVNPYPLLVPAK